MKRKHLIASFLISLSLAAVPAVQAHVPPPETDGTAGVPGATVEQISSFVAHYDVRIDGTLGVEERIEYFFPESRHGIDRDIPVSHVFENGEKHRLGITVQSVTNGDGMPVHFELQKNTATLRVKIGDADRMVSGTQIYDITYSVLGALRYDVGEPKHDELYWNVTGNGWEVPIRRVSAEVRLPSEVGQAAELKCYSGDTGSTASNCLAGMNGSTATFAANQPLTVVVGWPTGIVAHAEVPPPTAVERALPFAPLALPVMVLVCMHLMWSRFGRDPKGRGTMVVQYDAPPGMTPAEVGVIIDEKAGTQDISATIVDLAVRGYLAIEEVETQGIFLKGKDYQLQLKKPEFAKDSALKPFEIRLLDGLFGGYGNSVLISQIKSAQTFGVTDLPAVSKKLYSQVVADGYFPRNPENAKAAWIFGGLLVVVTLIFLMGSALRNVLDQMPFVFAGASVASCVIVVVYGLLMSVKTPKGVEAHEHAVGFREYLSQAEKYRLQWQEKENIFEKFLPYAMAFGVADKWSKTFASMQLAQPNWYRGSAWQNGQFNAIAFYGAMNSMNGAMMGAMRSAPSSSSSGSGFSGGSSGGGFGGGGGGSW